MSNLKNLSIFVVVVSISALFLISCATGKLAVMPEKTALTPALFKKPIKFSGSGFKPNEVVTIELIVPKGIKMKGLKEGEDRVGVAVGTADEKGNFEAAIGALTTLNSLFQVGWTPSIKPNFKEAKPLPAGKYEIIATGVDSDRTAKTILEIVPPPKKK